MADNGASASHYYFLMSLLFPLELACTRREQKALSDTGGRTKSGALSQAKKNNSASCKRVLYQAICKTWWGTSSLSP